VYVLLQTDGQLVCQVLAYLRLAVDKLLLCNVLKPSYQDVMSKGLKTEFGTP